MKTLTAAAFLCLSLGIFAQTSVIGVKSHHGDATEIPASTDNFGEIAPTPIYDTIIKIDKECVIQIGQDNGWGMAFRDTVCDHWYYKNVNFDADKIQEFHGGNVELIGFDNEGSDVKPEKSPFFKKRSKSKAKWLFAVIVTFLFGAYVLRPKLTPSKS